MDRMQYYLDFDEVKVDNLQKILSKYVPSELLEGFEKAKLDLNGKTSVNIHEFLQSIVDRSDNNFKMYGSGAELAENLADFEDFPLSFNLFGFEDDYRATSMYQHPKYRNLKGQLYLTKREFVQQIQSSIRQKYKLMETEPSFKMEQFMERREGINNDFYELFRYDRKVVDDINQRLFKVSTVDLKETIFMTQIPLYFLSFEFLKQHFHLTKESFRKSWDEADAYEYQKLSEKYAKWFYPVCEVEGFNMPAIVRIFEDGDQKFVMKHELFNNTIIKKPSDEKAEKTGVWSTMDLNEVFKIFRDQVKDIEFIRFPIKRAKHAAVPVVAPDASHCILAADALLQFLRHLISGLQVFQEPSSKLIDWSTLFSYFSPESESRLFVKTTGLDEIKNNADELWSGKKAKQVKSVDDFDLKTLIREMKRIGLENTFPDIICDFAEGAFQSVVENKKEPKLRTCDLIDAIEICQLACVFDNYPQLTKFMHNQKACHQLPLVPCLHCTFEKAALNLKCIERAISVPTTDSKSEQSEKPEDLSLKTEALEQDTENDVKKEKDSGKSIPDSEEVIEINSEMVNLEKTLKEKDVESVLEKEPKLWKIKKLKFSEAKESMEDIMKSTKDSIALEIEIKTNDEQLNAALEKVELEVTVKTAVLSVNREKEEKLEATIKGLQSQLMEKDEQIYELKKEHLEECKMFSSSISDLERKLNAGLKELDVKDSKIHELESRISKLTQEKDAEIQKLKKQQVLAAKENKKEMEQMERNATKSADELKTLTAKFSKNENLMKRSIEGLHEKLRNSESTRQEITIRRSHLETEVNEKNRLILELQKSVEKQVSEQEKAKKELETRISTIRGLLDEISQPEPKPEPVPSENSENLSIQKLKTLFNAPGPFELAKEMVEKLISLSNRPEIHQMARYELQQYQGNVENYLRELERKTKKVSKFPAFSDRFMSEYWKEIDKNSQITLSDSECFICFSEMKFDEEPTLKCEHCRKIVHFECASKWLKIHRSCAHCRREMLDPNEFPSLR